MNPKAVFLEDKELVKWWVNVVHDIRFDKVTALAVAELAMRRPSPDALYGASNLIDILTTFSDSILASTPFPSPGLIHQTPGRTTSQTEKPKA